jgi:coenzyme F420-reducing hydrogenase alpha subunit
MSHQVKILLMKMTSPVLLSPTLSLHFHHHLCASWLKVSDSESDESDDEFDPNEFSNLIHEYTYIIKREKYKINKLESADASLESSHNGLLAKYNALLKEHDESLILSKQVSDQYDKLKFEHVNLRQKYNYLELAYEALEDNLE